MSISETLIEQLRVYFSRNPAVLKVYLFGSFARGEADKNSDMDFLLSYDFTLSVRQFDWFLMRKELSEITGRKTDIVNENALSEHVRFFVEKDKILIYERKE